MQFEPAYDGNLGDRAPRERGANRRTIVASLLVCAVLGVAGLMGTLMTWTPAGADSRECREYPTPTTGYFHVMVGFERGCPDTPPGGPAGR